MPSSKITDFRLHFSFQQFSQYITSTDFKNKPLILTEKLWNIKRAPESDPNATCSPGPELEVVVKVTGSFSDFTKFPLHIYLRASK